MFLNLFRKVNSIILAIFFMYGLLLAKICEYQFLFIELFL